MHGSSSTGGWRFDNTYARLPSLLFSRELPTPVAAPRLVIFNRGLADVLGLDPGIEPTSVADLLAGNRLPDGADPIAQAYAGHQFGHFTNLGDGRAILLGEQLTPDGRRFDIQLKGSGRTRYSRGGDGRAALGPMLREYVISEAMHGLGIPSTHSLGVVTTGEVVLRDRPLPGAVLARVAASHVRVGSFQYAAAMGTPHLLTELFAYTLARHDPDLRDTPDRVTAWLEAVAERQAALVARWMLIGFVHGVMNTDNMAVSGETIDYGPCAFLDTYDPAAVFSSIDHQGRYAYANQPAIAHWNLARLAESLLPLMLEEADAVEQLQAVLASFPERFRRHHLAGARAKLGLSTEEEGDQDLFDTLLARMHAARADFTETFAGLAARLQGRPQDPAAQTDGPADGDWGVAWRRRLDREPGSHETKLALMQRVNPVVIPRNHRVEEALLAAEGGALEPLEKLLTALREPYSHTEANESYRCGPPAGCGPYRTFCGT